MTVKLTAAEAKALFARGEPGAPRTARTATPSGAYHTVCTSLVSRRFALTVKCTAQGPVVTLQERSDALDAVAPLAQVSGRLDIDRLVVEPGVARWQHDLEVARLVVRLVVVDVVDVLMSFGTGDDAVLVGSDVLRICAPDEFDVAGLADVPLWLSGRWHLPGSECPVRQPLASMMSPATVITAAALARRARYVPTAVDADDFPHTVMVTHRCAAEFRTRAAEDRHVAPGHNRFALVLELLG